MTEGDGIVEGLRGRASEYDRIAAKPGFYAYDQYYDNEDAALDREAATLIEKLQARLNYELPGDELKKRFYDLWDKTKFVDEDDAVAWMRMVEEVNAYLHQLETELEKLQEALKPFAETPYGALSKDDAPDHWTICSGITIADLRRARALIGDK